MSLQTLPPELLSEIFLFTLPPRFPLIETQYRTRVKELSRISLVCRTLHRTVIPLLLSVVWVRNSRQFKALIETVKTKQNGHQVCRLILAYSKGTVPKTQVATAAKTFTSIRELSLLNMKLDDLTVLNGFQGQSQIPFLLTTSLIRETNN